ncbi:6PF2K domain-containing protein, partial [Haematococcus lacustris]
NTEGRIGGDSDLSPAGWDYAAALPDVLLQRLPMTSDDQPIPVSVWTSTLKRTIQTARGLPFPALRWKALDEIHAGSCDGLTYSEIAAQFPGEYLARSQDKLRY